MRLSEIMIPPLSSNVMNADAIDAIETHKNLKHGTAANQSSGDEGGRPEKPDDEKSEKTIQNKESMS